LNRRKKRTSQHLASDPSWKDSTEREVSAEDTKATKPSATGVASVTASSSNPDSNSFWTATVGLRRLKARFPAIWLWESCNKALPTDDDYGYRRSSERQSALASVFWPSSRIGQYPLRPSFTLPSSTSVNALRSVLAVASDEVDSSSSYDGDTSYFWKAEYRERLFQALIVVINEHGLEHGGWKSVRWLVYDEYSRCVGGIHHHRYGNNEYQWLDDAVVWLQGCLATSLHDYQQTRGDCDSGEVYNTMLPPHVDGV